MVLVSVREASKLTGISVPTLYRHCSSGKLSKTDSKIDTSELIRVYGELNTPTSTTTSYQTETITIPIDVLLKQLDNLQLRLDKAEDRADKQADEVMRLVGIIENRLLHETVETKPVTAKTNGKIEQVSISQVFKSWIKW